MDVAICSFLFSSRRRHTRFKCDWSSDVCSSDLAGWDERSKGNRDNKEKEALQVRLIDAQWIGKHFSTAIGEQVCKFSRSEERRVGKGVDLGGRRIIKKKKKRERMNSDHKNTSIY